jgi:replicative DNA helicase
MSGSDTSGLATPPQSLESEQSVLGAVLLSDTVMPALLDECGLTGEMFYRQTHGRIFQGMVDMHTKGEPVDALTLVDHLRREGVLDHVGGPTAIELLTGSVPAVGNVRQYAAIVRHKHVLRLRLHAAYEQIACVHEDDDDGWTKALALADGAASLRHASCDVDVAEDFIKWYKSPPGLPTPFEALTKAIGGGLVRGENSACSGWPRMGKTVMADQFVETISATGARCHIFVNEMNTGVRTARMLARQDAASWQRIRDRTLTPAEWSAVERMLPNLPIEKYTKSHGWEVEEYVRAIRRHRWDFWVIDSTSRIPSRDTKDLERVSGMLADVAGETDTCGMLVLQLNLERAKGLERPSPTSRDLLGGGMWYRDCRNIFFVHRKQDIIGEEGEEQSVPLAEGHFYDDKGTHAEPGAGRVAVKFNSKRMAFEMNHQAAVVHDGMISHDGERMPF